MEFLKRLFKDKKGQAPAAAPPSDAPFKIGEGVLKRGGKKFSEFMKKRGVSGKDIPNIKENLAKAAKKGTEKVGKNLPKKGGNTFRILKEKLLGTKKRITRNWSHLKDAAKEVLMKTPKRRAFMRPLLNVGSKIARGARIFTTELTVAEGAVAVGTLALVFAGASCIRGEGGGLDRCKDGFSEYGEDIRIIGAGMWSGAKSLFGFGEDNADESQYITRSEQQKRAELNQRDQDVLAPPHIEIPREGKASETLESIPKGVCSAGSYKKSYRTICLTRSPCTKENGITHWCNELGEEAEGGGLVEETPTTAPKIKKLNVKIKKTQFFLDELNRLSEFKVFFKKKAAEKGVGIVNLAKDMVRIETTISGKDLVLRPKEKKTQNTKCFKANGKHCGEWCGKCLINAWDFENGGDVADKKDYTKIWLQYKLVPPTPDPKSKKTTYMEFNLGRGTEYVKIAGGVDDAREGIKVSPVDLSDGLRKAQIRVTHFPYSVLMRENGKGCRQISPSNEQYPRRIYGCVKSKELIFEVVIKGLSKEDVDDVASLSGVDIWKVGEALGQDVKSDVSTGGEEQKGEEKPAEAPTDKEVAKVAEAAGEEKGEGNAVTRFFRKLGEKFGIIEKVAPTEGLFAELPEGTAGAEESEITGEGAVGVREGETAGGEADVSPPPSSIEDVKELPEEKESGEGAVAGEEVAVEGEKVSNEDCLAGIVKTSTFMDQCIDAETGEYLGLPKEGKAALDAAVDQALEEKQQATPAVEDLAEKLETKSEDIKQAIEDQAAPAAAEAEEQPVVVAGEKSTLRKTGEGAAAVGGLGVSIYVLMKLLRMLRTIKKVEETVA